MGSTTPKISIIGFGEAAQAFTCGLLQDNASLKISAFDIKTNGSDVEAKRADYDRCGVIGADTMGDACIDAGLIISVVTADQVEAAASEAAKTNLNGAFYFDCNSCAPETKRRAATMIESAGGRYVDVAVMTPVHPRLHKSPCLLAGPHAEAALTTTNELGMVVEIAGNNVGDASVRKMVRSVMIKGLEALTLECFLAARKAGIEEDVLTSLDASFKGFDWRIRAPYMLERMFTHGVRRADEMVEVAKTLRDLGIEPSITEGTIARQREAGSLGLDANSIGAGDLGALTDAMLAAQINERGNQNGH